VTNWNLDAAVIAMFGTPSVAYFISQAARIDSARSALPLSELEHSSPG
jgi:hypothetical protein